MRLLMPLPICRLNGMIKFFNIRQYLNIKASQKADLNKFKFLKPNLNVAKYSWKILRTDAVTLKKGIKELKVDTVSPQK